MDYKLSIFNSFILSKCFELPVINCSLFEIAIEAINISAKSSNSPFDLRSLKISAAILEELKSKPKILKFVRKSATLLLSIFDSLGMTFNNSKELTDVIENDFPC